MAQGNQTVNASGVRPKTAAAKQGAHQSAFAILKAQRQAAAQQKSQTQTVSQQTTAANHKAKAMDDMANMRRRLFLRICLAGVVMLTLLLVVLLYEYHGKSQEPVNIVQETAETPQVDDAKVAAPSKEPEPAAIEIQPPVVAEVVDEATTIPERTEPPVIPPPPPEISAQPRLPVSPAASTAPRSVQKEPSRRGALGSSEEPTKSAGKRLTHISESHSPEALPDVSLAPPRLISGYALQAGVFADPKRAEELRAKLTLAGIPSTIETRIQVGPFKNRAEAETARKKLEAMGIGTILLPQGKASKHAASQGK